MTLFSAQSLGKHYGPQVVLKDVSFTVSPGERVGLVGINGSGKSTLSKILSGSEIADAGSIAMQRGAKIVHLSQEPIFPAHYTARQVVLEGLSNPDLEYQADALLDQLGITRRDAVVSNMSGGELRRVAIARTLVDDPDMAILDEPTNHLDIDTIEWLEEYLKTTFRGALLLITHDRYFLDRVVTRTLELSEGVLYSYEGGYGAFLEAKAERLALEARTESNRQNFLRREIEWLRRGPKARTTKQKARIDRAHTAIAAAPTSKGEQRVDLEIEISRTGKTILELKNVDVEVGGRKLISDMSMWLTKGERVGIIGPNGAGKTTLLKTILGERTPTRGEVVLGKNTQVAYFDQARTGLDPDKSIFDNVADGKNSVSINGVVTNVRSWLERFLFDSSKQRQPVGSLSGGERARVALAKLLLQPANLIVLDEPTNDLDTTTLGALEELLVELEGTALVVTHDRYFLDRIATGILSFEGNGEVVKYEGNHEMYKALKAERLAALKEEAASSAKKPSIAPSAPETSTPKPEKKKALTYGERLELERLPTEIEKADSTLATLEAKLADPGIYTDGKTDVPKLVKQVDEARAFAAKLLGRWEELEIKAAESA